MTTTTPATINELCDELANRPVYLIAGVTPEGELRRAVRLSRSNANKVQRDWVSRGWQVSTTAGVPRADLVTWKPRSPAVA